MMLKKFHYSRLLVKVMLIFGILKVVTDEVYAKAVERARSRKQHHFGSFRI